MNLFKKIGVAILSMAMTIGVGVAVGTKVEAKVADAASIGTHLEAVTSLTSGNEYIITNGNGTYALPTNPTLSSGKVAGTAMASVPNDCSGYLWTITQSGSYWIISDGTNNIYHSNGGGSGTNLAYGSSTTYKWKLTYAAATKWTFTGVNNTTENNRGMLVNGTNFGGYALSNAASYGYMNIYQRMAAATYSVTYDANGGTGNVPTDNTAYSDSASVTVLGNVGTPSTLSKANHVFSGWTLNAQGTGTVYGPGDGQAHTYTIDSANVTFYAKWVDTRTYCDITTSSSHLSLSGDTHVLEGEAAEVTISADAKWKIPESITVNGESSSANWDYDNGVLTILEVSEDMVIAGTATAASITAIDVEVDASETSFYLGHEFTHSTAVVTGIYDDAYLTEEDVTDGCTWSEPDMFTTGNSKMITVTHTATSLTDTYTISVSNKPVSAGGIAKVTNVADLTVGSTVYLVCEGRSKQFNGINTSGSTHYGNGADYSTSIASATYPLTVAAGYSEGTIAFKTGNNYLYWTSGNSLDTNATLSNKTSWTISISSGNATILNKNDNSRQIMWNVSSPRFACYSGQTPTYDTNSGYNMVQIYKDYPEVTKDLIKITATAKSATRYVGDTVTVSDFNVTAYYDDGTNESVTATSLTNATLNSASNTVTVNYTESEITKSVNVDVSAEVRTAELTGLAWAQTGLTILDGGELDFSTLGEITAEYDDGDDYATKGIASCTVGLYSKDGLVYTREKTISDGHAFALSENGLYLGVEYTEDATTVKAYASAVVNVVETINAVYEQVPSYSYSRVTTISAGDIVTFVNEANTKVASGFDTNIITVSSYSTNVETNFNFEVGKVGDYYTFHNANGYLGNHSTGTSGNNYAYLDAEIDEESNKNYFTVSFDGNNVVITSVYESARKLQFNGTRFCFYGSNQSVVQLYKGTSGYSPTGGNIANTNAVAQKAALDYVDYFNTTMACVNDGSTANISTKWTAVSSEFTRVLGTLAGDDLINFKALFAYAYARGSDEFNDTDALQDMLAKYNHIVSAHGVSDFLNSNPINRPAAQYAANNVPALFSINDGSAALIIIVISSITLATIGGYFLIRRRKEN